MQQRIGIGQALIGKPEFLVCDEPMSGLDPVGYKEMRDIFIDLKFSDTTLFLNTHILDEVERICDRVGVLHEGVLKDIRDVPRSWNPICLWIIGSMSNRGTPPNCRACLSGVRFPAGGDPGPGEGTFPNPFDLDHTKGQGARDSPPFLPAGSLFPEGHRFGQNGGPGEGDRRA